MGPVQEAIGAASTDRSDQVTPPSRLWVTLPPSQRPGGLQPRRLRRPDRGGRAPRPGGRPARPGARLRPQGSARFACGVDPFRRAGRDRGGQHASALVVVGWPPRAASPPPAGYRDHHQRRCGASHRNAGDVGCGDVTSGVRYGLPHPAACRLQTRSGRRSRHARPRTSRAASRAASRAKSAGVLGHRQGKQPRSASRRLPGRA
jgi:hypothetical protein